MDSFTLRHTRSPFVTNARPETTPNVRLGGATVSLVSGSTTMRLTLYSAPESTVSYLPHGRKTSG